MLLSSIDGHLQIDMVRWVLRHKPVGMSVESGPSFVRLKRGYDSRFIGYIVQVFQFAFAMVFRAANAHLRFTTNVLGIAATSCGGTWKEWVNNVHLYKGSSRFLAGG